MNKFLVVGLGNPGEEYAGTRHNIGFAILDHLSLKFKSTFNLERYGFITNFKTKGRNIFLLKPSTFMNLSGKSVRFHLAAHKIPMSNLLIISDDLHLAFNTIKLRRKGSDGGHNGHKDIIEKLNSSNYARLKFGIGNNFHKGNQSKYVLEKWSKIELENLNSLVVKASNTIISFCTVGIDNTMKEFN